VGPSVVGRRGAAWPVTELVDPSARTARNSHAPRRPWRRPRSVMWLGERRSAATSAQSRRRGGRSRQRATRRQRRRRRSRGSPRL